MEITRVEAVDDAPGGLVEAGKLAADRPIAGKAPLIEHRPRCAPIDGGLVRNDAARRCEVLALAIAEVCLARAQVAEIGRSLRTCGPDTGRDTGHAVGDSRAAGSRQEPADHLVEPVVASLAE